MSSESTAPSSESSHISSADFESKPSSVLPEAVATEMVPTTYSSMDEFRTQSPSVYQAMLQGIAQTILMHMQDSQERLRDLMHELEADLKRR